MQKKRLQKSSNIGEMRPVLKLRKMVTKQRLYILCKMVSLGEKLKRPKTWGKRLYQNTKNVVWKKRLQKTANIGEMRPF